MVRLSPLMAYLKWIKHGSLSLSSRPLNTMLSSNRSLSGDVTKSGATESTCSNQSSQKQDGASIPVSSQPTSSYADTLFNDQVTSQDYAAYRSRYSDEVFQVISDYCRETVPDLNLAVDVGCGPGNSTVGFTKHFKQVIGVDISETQIAWAPKNIPNCRFRVSYAHQLPFLQTGSVDLFCSGLAFNFMPQTETFAEADRVLRPGGTIAIFGYGSPKIADARINQVLKEAFEYVVPRTPKELHHSFELNKDLELPYPGGIKREDVVIEQKLPVHGFDGLWRILQRLMNQNREDADSFKNFATEFQQKFSAAVQESHGHTDGVEVEIQFETVIIMGHKPL